MRGPSSIASRIERTCQRRLRLRSPRWAATSRSGPAGRSRSTTSAPRGSAPGRASRRMSRTLPFREQQRIAVPAMPVRLLRGRDERQAGLLFERLEVEQALAAAETLVGLLDGDHVGVHLGDDGGDPRRLEAAVGADAFVDVVGGDDEFVVAIGLDALAAAARRSHRPPASPAAGVLSRVLMELNLIFLRRASSTGSRKARRLLIMQ